jgi:hypothetical protein
MAGVVAAMLNLNDKVAKALVVGPKWLGPLADHAGFAMLPFGLLVVFLILVGGEVLLRSGPRRGATTS